MTGLAGEFFVAAELLKREILTSITFGSAKAVDLLAHNPRNGRNYTVQVKAIRTPNVFPISHARVAPDHIYVFVVLNKVGVPPTYYVVPGAVLKNEPERFSKWFKDPKFPGFRAKYLETFENAWSAFEEVQHAV